MKRYTRFEFSENKNIGSFLNSKETANKAVNQIKKILTSHGMFLQSRLGKIGWTVYWNGFEILIDFSPLYKKNKKGFYTNILGNGQEDEFKKGFFLIKNRYSSANLNERDLFQIIIPSEDE